MGAIVIFANDAGWGISRCGCDWCGCIVAVMKLKFESEFGDTTVPTAAARKS
jgi:hypothetical protein